MPLFFVVRGAFLRNLRKDERSNRFPANSLGRQYHLDMESGDVEAGNRRDVPIFDRAHAFPQGDVTSDLAFHNRIVRCYPSELSGWRERHIGAKSLRLKILPASACGPRIKSRFSRNMMILIDRGGGGYTPREMIPKQENKIDPRGKSLVSLIAPMQGPSVAHPLPACLDCPLPCRLTLQ
jgi:hypothetical protein